MRLLLMGKPSLNDYEDDEDYDFFYKESLAPYDFLDKASKGLICCISLQGMHFPGKHIILVAFSCPYL